MNKVLMALTALTLTAGAASASSGDRNEWGSDTMSGSAQGVEVRAESVMTTAELSRSGLDGDEIITVSSFSGPAPIWNDNQDR